MNERTIFIPAGHYSYEYFSKIVRGCTRVVLDENTVIHVKTNIIFPLWNKKLSGLIEETISLFGLNSGDKP